ncbi:MAG: DUF2061 domain-containing protein [Candidatus Freyarchaeota archaeon]
MIRSVSWRVVATLITFTVSMVLTGGVEVSGLIAVCDSVAKFVAYYLHERGWLRLERRGS